MFNIHPKTSLFAGLICGVLSTASSATAEPIRARDYVSPLNFGLGALSVSEADDQGRIQMIIRPAVLTYPDRGFNFAQRDELARVFKLPDLNSLIITFDSKDCSSRTLPPMQESDIDETPVGQPADEFGIQVWNCRQPFATVDNVTIQGSQFDLLGEQQSVSDITLQGREFFTGVFLVRKYLVDRNTSSLRAQVSGTIMLPDGKEPITISLKKSGLSVGRE